MRKLKLFIAIAAMGLVLSACNEASLPVSSSYTEEELENIADTIETPWVDYSTPATKVSFPEEEKKLEMVKGDTLTLHPTIEPRSATLAALVFTSMDQNVVTVSNEAVVTAVGGGSTSIVVSSKESSFDPITIYVNVTVKITNFTVEEDALDLGYGYTAQLHVVHEPADTTELDINYYSSDDLVASVSPTGLVTAKNMTGTATITIQSPFINTERTVTVSVSDKVIHATSVTIANKQANIEIDKSFTVNASVMPSNAEDTGIEYSSSNEEVATVDANGLVSALKAGTTTIKAMSHENNAILDQFDLEVIQVFATQLVVESPLDLIINAQQQLHPSYKDGENQPVTPSRSKLSYESSDKTVATVTDGGLVTAKGIGTATITVTDEKAGAASISTTVTVNVTLDIATFTISGFENFTPNAGCKVFAWVWGGDAGSGAWYEVQLTYEGTKGDYSNVNGTFDAPRNITGLVLARCTAATVTPDWSLEDGDDAGRIYNKTSDITNTGVAIAAPEWLEYPEPETLTGFGIKFASGVSHVGTEDGYDMQGKAQYALSNIAFHTGAEFSIYDFTNNAGWAETPEGYSFGGASADAENWKAYLELDEPNGKYTVLADFTADIYLKIDISGNSIYFGLKEEIPTGETYSVKIGTETTDLVKGEASLDGEVEYYSASGLEVTAGQPVVFYADNVAITSNFGPDADNLTPGSESYNNFMGSVASGLTIQADGTVSVHFHVWTDGLSFFISGGNSATHEVPAPVFTPYVTHGSGDNFTNVNLADNPGNENEYFVSLTLAANEEVKFCLADNDEDWRGFSQLKAGIPVTVDEGSDGNIRFADAGTYDFYVTKTAGDGTIWVELQPVPVVLADVYSMKINNVDVGLTKSTTELSANEAFKFTATGVAVEAGHEIEMFADAVAIAADLSADADDLTLGDEKYNNYIGSLADGFFVQASGTVDITMHIWESGWVTFWISGGNSADHTIPVVYNYYITGSFNNWKTTDLSDGDKLTKVNDGQYKIENVGLVDGAQLKVYWPDGEQEVDRYFTNGETWTDCGFSLDGDGNIVINGDGVYTINFYPGDTHDPHHYVAIDKTDDLDLTFTATVGGTPYTLEYDSGADYSGSLDALYKVTIPGGVTSGNILMFAKNGFAIRYFNIEGGNNNIINDEGILKVKDTTAEDVVLYLNIWEPNGAGEVWATAYLEGAAVVATSYRVTGLIDWTPANGYLMTVDGSDANHYSVSDIEIHSGEKFKVVEIASNTWYGSAIWDGCGFTIDGDGNVVVSADGVYTINFYLSADGGKHISITKTGEILTLQLSSESANLTVGGEAAVITASNVTGALTKTGGDDAVATVAIAGSNITITPVAAGSTSVTIGDDGAVTRTIIITVSSAETYEYTITLSSSWVWNDGVAVLAWVYGGTYGSGAWVEITKVNDTTITFTVPASSGATGVTFARFAGGTTPATADWNNKYNESPTTAFNSGVYAYNLIWNS